MKSAMPRNLLFLPLFVLLSACTARAALSPTPGPEQIKAQEQAVYAFLLSSMYQHHAYVIMATTATGPTGVDDTARSLDYVLQNMHGVSPATADSFRARNSASNPLSANMDLGNPYTLLSQAARNQIFGQNRSGWDTFYGRYPQAPGITTLSSVGFNATFDQALVYIGTQSNWLAGQGYYVLLKKTGGVWSIDQQVMTWVS
jgi:hypothetical protein